MKIKLINYRETKKARLMGLRGVFDDFEKFKLGHYTTLHLFILLLGWLSMYILKATFDRDLAVSKMADMLALADNPERMSDKLNLREHRELIEDGIRPISGKKLIQAVAKVKETLSLDQEIGKIQEGGTFVSKLLGKSFARNKMEKLNERRRRLGNITEAPRWFYHEPRVWLLSALRDFAMEVSNQDDAEWVDSDQGFPVVSPLMDMFDTGNVAFAKLVAEQLELPLAEVDPVFILQNWDGHRSLVFDFENSVVTYFVPVRDTA